tara:strand:+ start:4473 stop:4775 length:303 start_codon:yes stop_codon:yes gene_type:complete
MEVDVLIYINTLKNFFDKDQQAYQDMFGTLTIDKDIFFDKVSELAKKNYKDKGEATLSTDQIYEVVDGLLEKKLTKSQKDYTTNPTFQKILKDFPPFSLN